MQTKREARKILEELRSANRTPIQDDEKTLELIERMISGKPEIETDPMFFERLRSRLLSEAENLPQTRMGDVLNRFAKFLSVPLALAGIAAIASTLGFFDFPKNVPVAVPTESDLGTGNESFGALSENPPTAERKDSTETSETESAPKLATPKVDKYENPVRKPVKGAETSTVVPNSEPSARTLAKNETEDRSLMDFDSRIDGATGDSAASADSSAGASSFAEESAVATPSSDGFALSSPGLLKSSPKPDSAIIRFRYSFSGSLPSLSGMKTYGETKSPQTFERLADVGLTVYPDVEGGTLSFGRNFEKWPESASGARSLSNKEIADVTEKFAQDWKIDLSRFGAPSVDVSDASATVTYPAFLDGYPVYDENGFPKTAWFTVDLRESRITGGFIDVALVKAASERTALSNEAVLKKLSDAGSANPNASELAMEKVSAVYVGRYVDENGTLVEKFVPSFRFETDRKPKENEYFQSAVVVPAFE